MGSPFHNSIRQQRHIFRESYFHKIKKINKFFINFDQFFDLQSCYIYIYIYMHLVLIYFLGQKWITLYNQLTRKRRVNYITFNNTIKLTNYSEKRLIRGTAFTNKGIPMWLLIKIPMPILFSTKVTSILTFKILGSAGFQIY